MSGSGWGGDVGEPAQEGVWGGLPSSTAAHRTDADGKVVVFFQSAANFKVRYWTVLRVSRAPSAIWPVASGNSGFH
jgi:hypothetical protein